jgi:hypothetical protein
LTSAHESSAFSTKHLSLRFYELPDYLYKYNKNTDAYQGGLQKKQESATADATAKTVPVHPLMPTIASSLENLWQTSAK